jgi:hypothetical protein
VGVALLEEVKKLHAGHIILIRAVAETETEKLTNTNRQIFTKGVVSQIRYIHRLTRRQKAIQLAHTIDRKTDMQTEHHTR